MRAHCEQRQESERVIMNHSAAILSECLSALRAHPRAPIEAADIVQDVHVAVVVAAGRIARAREPGALVRHIARVEARKSVTQALRAPVTLDDEDMAQCLL